SRVYAQKFPERNHPKPTVFKRLLHQFEESGSVNYKNPLQGNLSLKMKKTFSRYLVQLSKIPMLVKISYRKVLTLVNQLCQKLDGNDFENRTEFCMWVLNKVAGNEKFFENVLFSDECTFHNNGLVNRHNFHYYSDTNPREWFDVSPNQHVASIGWSSASLALRSSAIFKCQLSKQVDWQKWVSKLTFQISGLNSTRFLFVAYIKGIVYDTLPTTSHDLKTHIRHAFKTVTPQMSS
ncbi:hypothetical protein D910_00474, partial [Dendroctonus ponderosae]